MCCAIFFKTSKFDVSRERENPINSVYGHSLLDWLGEKLKDQVDMTAPDAEDWGWYSYLEWQGRKYLLGASVHYPVPTCSTGDLEWVFQIDKQRSLMEKILGKEQMNRNDSCVMFFKKIFEACPDIKEIRVD